MAISRYTDTQISFALIHKMNAAVRAHVHAFAAADALAVIDPGDIVVENDGLLFAGTHAFSAADAAVCTFFSRIGAFFMARAHNNRSGFIVVRV